MKNPPPDPELPEQDHLGDQGTPPSSSGSDEGDPADEFSLEQLSEAYAEVLARQQPHTGEPETPPAEAESERNDPPTGESGQADEAVRRRHDLECCPITPESILEALLFVGSPRDVRLTSRALASLMRNISPREITQMAKKLQQAYERENAAFQIHSEKGVHRMQMAPELAQVQRRFLGRDKAVRLSQAAIDVLAIVAYNQPVSREKVEKIRGKPSGGILNQMVRRELLAVEAGGGNIKQFRTTERFLDLFDLEHIRDLPQTHDLDDIDDWPA